MRHFLTLRDFSKDEITRLLDFAADIKAKPRKVLPDKTLAMIFEKNSTRTRMAFELAITQLGGHALFLSANDLQLSRGEPVKDTARVIGAMVDFTMLRVNSHETLTEFAKYSKCPVINALSDLYHPTQVLGDLLTMREFGKAGKVAFVGDANNMCNSWLIAAAILGLEFSVAVPQNYEINGEILEFALSKARNSGAKLDISHFKARAIKDAQVIITDTWVSMGQEGEKEQRVRDFAGFIVDEQAMSEAASGAIFLHCLPAYRGFEVSEGVFEAHSEEIFAEAVNRLYVVKSVLCFLDECR